MAEPREVTITTQAHRRELRIGELSPGSRLPFHPSTGQLATFALLAVVGGLVSLMLSPLHVWMVKPLALLVFPAAGAWLYGAAQGVGRSPATAVGAWCQYAFDEVVYRARHLERPEQFKAKTAVVSLPELEDQNDGD
jgi:hypothetical protein